MQKKLLTVSGCSFNRAFNTVVTDFFRKIFFGGHQFFFGATDTPVLDFWWHLPWVSKLGKIRSLTCFFACMQWIPQIHLWCGTCWPFGGQHGSLAILSTYLHTSTGGLESRMENATASQHVARQTLPTELSWLSYGQWFWYTEIHSLLIVNELDVSGTQCTLRSLMR